jgi:uncharacterized protein YodC (DUF2158 family)
MTDESIEFKPGDIVVLKSGGQRMTVERVGPADMTREETVLCVWKETVGKREEVRREGFVPATLRKWEPPKATVMVRR